MPAKFNKWIYRIALAVLTVVLLAAFSATAAMWIKIEEDARELAEYTARFPIVSMGDLPEDFDEAAYREACERYDIEHGLVLPLG